MVLLACAGVPSELLHWDATDHRFVLWPSHVHPRLEACSRASLRRALEVAREGGTHFRRLDTLAEYFGGDSSRGGQVRESGRPQLPHARASAPAHQVCFACAAVC